MSICSVFKHLRTLKFSHTRSRAFSRTTWLYSHYKTLDLPQDASQKQVKDAYFTLSKKYHPDLHPNDPKCHEKFIKLQEAYKVLSNPKTREEYDSATNNRSYGYSQGNYSSQAQSQYYNQRAWNRPDFSKRDEWIRHDRIKREQREREFQENFSGKKEFHEFNRFYSRPHNLTPEEIEFLLQQRKFSKNNKVGLIILGIVFLVMFIESAVSMRRYGTFERMYENSRRMSRQGVVGFEVPGLVPNDQFRNNQNNFEDYLHRRDLRQNNRDIIYDDTHTSE